MKVAVVGATGMVGQVMLKVLQERNFPVSELIPVASERSAGKQITFNGKQFEVVTIEKALTLKPEIALFSAGGDTSKEFAPKFAEIGTTVIDNSSAWRMDPNIKLVVPEINGNTLTSEDKIIANPNCSTIQMVLALAPLHKEYGVKRVVVSTYQSVSGSGLKAVNQLDNERKGVEGEMAYPHPIDKNCLPHIDVFLENGYTKEEMKMINETKKIMGDDSVKVTATTVRVPVEGGHSESLNITFAKEPDLNKIKDLLSQTEGIVVQDDPQNNVYPMPIIAANKDEVFVGRIRKDESLENTINMWVVADNLRKGAATNAVQIAQHLVSSAVLA